MNDVLTLDTPLAGEAESKIKVLSVRQLMWLRFKRNRLAVIGSLVLLLLYLMALFAGFVAPYNPRTTHEKHPAAPPQLPRVIDLEGQFHWPPFVYETKSTVDPKTFRRSFAPIGDVRYPIRFFAQGEPYLLFGLIPASVHVFQVDEPAKIFLMGTDPNGRDLFSRVAYGAQVSLTVGLLGVAISLIIGTLIGIASGYLGGIVDNTTQRFIDLLIAFPLIPLWLALAAIVPPTWTSVQRFFAISILLSLVTWGASGAPDAWQRAVVTRSRLCARRVLCQQQHMADHHDPPDAQYIEPRVGDCHPGHPYHDFGRDCVKLSWPGHPAADDQLGTAAQ